MMYWLRYASFFKNKPIKNISGIFLKSQADEQLVLKTYINNKSSAYALPLFICV